MNNNYNEENIMRKDFLDQFIFLCFYPICSKTSFKSISLIRFIFGYRKDGYIKDNIPVNAFFHDDEQRQLSEKDINLLTNVIGCKNFKDSVRDSGIFRRFKNWESNGYGEKYKDIFDTFSANFSKIDLFRIIKDKIDKDDLTKFDQMFFFFETLFCCFSDDLNFSEYLINNLNNVSSDHYSDLASFYKYYDLYKMIIFIRKEISNEISDLISKTDISVWNNKSKQEIPFYLKYDHMTNLFTNEKLKKFVSSNLLYDKYINKLYQTEKKDFSMTKKINLNNKFQDNISNKTIKKQKNNNLISNKSIDQIKKENFLNFVCSEEERFVAQCFDFSFVSNRRMPYCYSEEVYRIGVRNLLKCYILKYFVIKKLKTIDNNSDILNFFLYLVLSYNPGLFFINFDLFEKFSGIKIDYLEDIKFDQKDIDIAMMSLNAKNGITSVK